MPSLHFMFFLASFQVPLFLAVVLTFIIGSSFFWFFLTPSDLFPPPVRFPGVGGLQKRAPVTLSFVGLFPQLKQLLRR